MNVDDLLMLLSGNCVRVPLPVGQYQLAHVFSASVPFPYVTSNLRAPLEVEHDVTAQSTVHPNGSYVVPTTVDIDGLSLTASKIGLVRETRRTYEFLHFGYMAQM